MPKSIKVPDIFNQAEFLIDRHLKECRGDRIAVCYHDRKIACGELAAYVNRAGNILRNMWVEIQNRVVLILRNCPELFYTYFGAMKIGAEPLFC